LVAFVKQDVRGRVLRRWLLSLLTGIRWFPGARWGRTSLLQKHYAKLFNDKPLRALGQTVQGTSAPPELHLLATSMTTGSLCSFSKDGFWMGDGRSDKLTLIDSLPIALGVAASSAFPPLFPPVRITREMLHVIQPEFPNDEYLADGGVFDNLGIRKLQWLRERNNLPIDLIIVSDAQGRFDWALGKRYSLLPSRATRASDLLMKRVSDLEYEILGDSTANKQCEIVRCELQEQVSAEDDPSAMPPQIQHDSRSIRTDLDRFSLLEIEVLVRRGYSTAKRAWKQIKNALIPALGDIPLRPWIPVTPPEIAGSVDDGSADLRRSRNLKARLWSFRDWTSWVTTLYLMLIRCLVLSPYLWERSKREQAESQVTTLKNELDDIFLGESRRAAKTSVAKAPVEHFEGFEGLNALLNTLPSDDRMLKHDPPITKGPDSDRVAEEQRNVKLYAYLYAAAREPDNDFHLILGLGPMAPKEAFLLAEISGIPRSGPSIAELQVARRQFKDRLGASLPARSYKIFDPHLLIRITGSLFYDVDHPPGIVGPSRFRPATNWEIHPITKIDFLDGQ
jgi:predicted acylesterase/phospholipase RssA